MSFVLLGILNSQATGGVVPAPDFLTSAPLWLDAADASTITESGGSVSQWDNKGTGSNFVQATSADQPTTGVSTLNGLNVLDFDSNVLGADGAAGEFNFLHDGTKCFVAMVISHTSNGTINIILETQDGSSGNIGYSHFADDRSDNEGIGIQIGNGSTFVRIIEGDTGFFPGAFGIMTHVLDLTASTADTIEYFRNNTQGTLTNSRTGSLSSSDSENKLGIGDTISGSGLPLFGKIGELIIVSGADATETNRQAVVDYLNEKWSVFV